MLETELKLNTSDIQANFLRMIFYTFYLLPDIKSHSNSHRDPERLITYVKTYCKRETCCKRAQG